MTEDPEADLLAAVQADPSDLQARAIYADWLEERGDPRGEYLRLDMQLVSLPARLGKLVEVIDPTWISAVSGRFCITISAIGANKIGAIKVVREVTGLGLKDAKDLVERVSATRPVVLKNGLELEEAHDIAGKCAPVMTVEVTPRLPARAPVAPSGPGGYRRPYRVLLVGATDRLGLIRAIHTRCALSLVDARDVVGQLETRPFELAGRLDATAAAELAVTFGGLGQIRIEHAK